MQAVLTGMRNLLCKKDAAGNQQKACYLSRNLYNVPTVQRAADLLLQKYGVSRIEFIDLHPPCFQFPF